MAILVCHIGWMAAYEGKINQPDDIVGGGAWVHKHKDGGETCNFRKCDDGLVYGHVETIKGKRDRPISIEKLGVSREAAFADHVDVVWTATHPQKKGRWVVGWYRNARVYRDRVAFRKPPSAQHRLETHQTNYRIQAKAGDVFVIPPKQRAIQLGRGKGWIGQANWWFPERSGAPGVRPFLRKARALLDTGLEPGKLGSLGPRGGRRWGGKSDPLRNAEVERAAILEVTRQFVRYKLKSVEKDNLGWDLEAHRKGDKTPLRLEVKGLFGPDLKVGLTSREYRAFKAHEEGAMANYRLCVVTNALSARPKLVVFRFDWSGNKWVDDHTERKILPKIVLVPAAIVNLA
jgi:hypothetical protein